MAAADSASLEFQHALNRAEAKRRGSTAETSGELALKPIVRATLDFGPSLGGGGESRWGLAMNWASEPDEKAAAPTGAAGASELTSDTTDIAEAIASELGIRVATTPNQLMRYWRAFIWRNHPDRVPDDARHQANTRVAVANALYDRARRALMKAK
jgi:hypothetical protein